MKKITNQQFTLLLLLVVVIIAAAAYRFGYLDYIEKADAVKSEINVLSARIDELNTKTTQKSVYETIVGRADEICNEVIEKYGAGNTPEKSIMFIRSLEKAAGMEISSVSFGTDDVFYSSSTLDANGASEVTAYRSQLSITYRTGYEGLKKAVDFINSSTERKNINSFTAAFDSETGKVSGSMIIDLYSVKAEGREYTEPTVSGVEIGLDNIFGTIEIH